MTNTADPDQLASSELINWGLMTRQPLWVILCHLPEKGRREIEEIVEMKERDRGERKMNESEGTEETRQSAQWGTYTPEERYHQFLTSTKYVALTLEMAEWMNSMLIAISPKPLCRRIIKFNKRS